MAVQRILNLRQVHWNSHRRELSLRKQKREETIVHPIQIRRPVGTARRRKTRGGDRTRVIAELQLDGRMAGFGESSGGPIHGP